MIMISACLAGEKCRYDGKANKVEELAKLAKEKKAILICPEVMGGLKTPRDPAEIKNGDGTSVLKGEAKIYTKKGQDVTKKFAEGAFKVLQIAEAYQPEYIILKENSPSCGSCNIYDGTFSKKLIEGMGVTAAILKREGFKIYSEYNYPNDNNK